MRYRGLLVVSLILGITNSLVGQRVQWYGTVKEKSFLERLVPGSTFQYQSQNRGGVDINMFAGYRFTDRLTAGIGWNERATGHFRRHFGLSRRRGVYGPRSFVDYKLPFNFSIRGELERMNAYVPPVLGFSPPGAEGSRKWIWGVFVGVKKSFRMTDWFRTNLQLLYNLDDQFSKTSPYSDRLNLRLGVEFFIWKRKSGSK